MKPEYFSFLICRHPDRADIYLSGRPVGTVVDGEFHIATRVTPQGNRVEITARDLPHTSDLPTFADLRYFLTQLIQQIPPEL